MLLSSAASHRAQPGCPITIHRQRTQDNTHLRNRHHLLFRFGTSFRRPVLGCPTVPDPPEGAMRSFGPHHHAIHRLSALYR